MKRGEHLSDALRAFREGDLERAQSRIDKALALQSAAAGTGGSAVIEAYLHVLAGRIAYSQEDYRKAEQSWRRALTVDADHTAAWNNLGVLYRRRGETSAAMQAFSRAEKLAPERPDIHYNIGNLHKAAGDYQQAVDSYNRSINLNPHYTPAYNNLGTLYESRQERKRAREVFQRGLSADSGNPCLHFNLGLIHQRQGEWKEARAAFDASLKRHPGWISGLNGLGITLRELGSDQQAAAAFRGILDIDPRNVDALNNLGVTYRRLNRADEAQECFQRALREKPDHLNAALNLSETYREKQEFERALEELNKQINHYPANPEIRIQTALTLMKLGRLEDGLRSLDHVLERSPDDPRALRAKADIHLAASRPREAEAILKRLPPDPGDPARLRLMADLIAPDQPEEALRLREQAAAAEPGRTDDLIALAALYRQTGEADRALEKLEETVNLLGNQGSGEDLDSMDTVLGLYEKAAAALEKGQRELFMERSAQLLNILRAAGGLSDIEQHRPDQFDLDAVPLEEDDTLSLLDMEILEPVIRINEDEETLFLEETAEPLDDSFAEVHHPEKIIAAPTAPSPRQDAPSPSPPSPVQTQGENPPDAPTAQSPSKQHSDRITSPSLFPFPTAQPPSEQYSDKHPPDPTPSASPPGEQQPSAAPAKKPSRRQTTNDSRDPSRNPQFDTLPPRGAKLEGAELAGQAAKIDTLSTRGAKLEDAELAGQDSKTDTLPPRRRTSGLTSGIRKPGETSPTVPKSHRSADRSAGPHQDSRQKPTAGQSSHEYSAEQASKIDTVPPRGTKLEGAELAGQASTDTVPQRRRTSGLTSGIRKPGETSPTVPKSHRSADRSAGPHQDSRQKPTAGQSSHEYSAEQAAKTDTVLPGNSSPEKSPVTESESLTPKQLAELFEYLLELTQESTDEGRRELIAAGIPLKFAALHAHLSRRPKLREITRRYDRRSAERRDVELDWNQILRSLEAFRRLADSLPDNAVRESLGDKLDKLRSAMVDKTRNDAD